VEKWEAHGGFHFGFSLCPMSFVSHASGAGGSVAMRVMRSPPAPSKTAVVFSSGVSINGVMEALRKKQDKIRYSGVAILPQEAVCTLALRIP
jgi:hypothetical protein